MNRRLVLLGIGLVVMTVVAAALTAVPREPTWTSSSPDAVLALEAALEANSKLYKNEAGKHLERALELDPDFVAAKIEMAMFHAYENPERAEKLMAEAIAADRSGLSDRELFMVERAELMRDMKFDEASAAMDTYLAEHPDDPYVIHLRALEVWQSGKLEEAERLNRRLLEISPNWVLSYNQLGYITMLQGRFAEAEEYFTSYRFIAPDQANPHDSLGELFIILGRYEQAIDSFNQALELRPDFWASYEHLALAEGLSGDFGGAFGILDRGQGLPDAPEDMFESIRCGLNLWQLEEQRDWQAIADQADGPCVERFGEARFAAAFHRAYCQLGRFDEARAIEDRYRSKIQEAEKNSWQRRVESMEPALLFMTGVRQALEGDLQGAATAFRAADRHLSYVTAQVGIYKLGNQLLLAEVERALGEDGMAHKRLSQVRSINPEMVREFENDGLSALGL
jgi:tetratricopeptide (TPR) repeat protein